MSSSTSLSWIKARASMGSNACVELAADGDLIVLRNSRDHRARVHFTHAEIAAFLAGAKAGEFDHLVERLAD